MNWNTDTYKNTPSWWNNNSNTNYYGTNTGPGYIYVDPQTSHGQNTTSYSSGNPVYRKSQQGQKPVIVIPSISVINTQIHNSASPVIHTYTSGIAPRTWEDELGDWMRDCFNSHSETVSAQNLKPLAEGVVLLHPLINITNDAFILTSNHDLYSYDVGAFDKVVAVADLLSFGVIKTISVTNDIIKLGIYAQRTPKAANIINKFTTTYSIGITIKNGYERK